MLVFVCTSLSCFGRGLAHADCGNPANPIEAENCRTGNPSSEWDISGSGDANIQGFATDISVNRGGTISFKVDTTATAYHIDVYRLGYYSGLGARKVATIPNSSATKRQQPACLSDSTTGLLDCGNWSVSATWSVPSDAVSGIYIARLVGEAGVTGSSHVVFVVRNDGGTSDLLFQTSDTTWQAYNRYGGVSLYGGNGPGGGLSGAGRAYKVSYNRPFTTRGTTADDWLFNAEYPMVRWLERNGYDVSYFTGVDADRRGAEIANHKVFLSVGHDEYWSKQQRLQRREGAGRPVRGPDGARAPRVLQRQRGLLEDALGGEHRRLERPPTGRSSATRRPTRGRRSTPRPSGPARGATRGSRRLPTAGIRRTR